MGIDAIVTLAGLVIPSVVDFVKKKFLKKDSNTTEATMSTLATTKPDVLPEYLNAVVGHLKAQIEYFNRDISGTPSQWVINLRAAIRPSGVVMAFSTLIVLAVLSLAGYEINETAKDTLTGVRLSCELVVSSWFGDRISLSK